MSQLAGEVGSSSMVFFIMEECKYNKKNLLRESDSTNSRSDKRKILIFASAED